MGSPAPFGEGLWKSGGFPEAKAAGTPMLGSERPQTSSTIQSLTQLGFMHLHYRSRIHTLTCSFATLGWRG